MLRSERYFPASWNRTASTPPMLARRSTAIKQKVPRKKKEQGEPGCPSSPCLPGRQNRQLGRSALLELRDAVNGVVEVVAVVVRQAVLHQAGVLAGIL